MSIDKRKIQGIRLKAQVEKKNEKQINLNA
jgi:hypothetical protein